MSRWDDYPTSVDCRSDLPTNNRDSLWRALICGYGCEVRP